MRRDSILVCLTSSTEVPSTTLRILHRHSWSCQWAPISTAFLNLALRSGATHHYHPRHQQRQVILKFVPSSCSLDIGVPLEYVMAHLFSE
ncbi:hypothetical protein ABKN59_002162 [Abortiporus biennis]